jgi:hypothetical protein
VKEVEGYGKGEKVAAGVGRGGKAGVV